MGTKKLKEYYVKSFSYFHREKIGRGHPEIFNIEITSDCPMSCKMCPRKEMKRKVGHMNFELFKKIIDQAKEYSDVIWFDHFGDPLVHPEFEKFIKYANSKGIETKISSNPTLLTEKNIQKIFNSGLKHLLISLDGTDEKTYKFLRGDNANYGFAVNNIKNLVKKKIEQKRKYPFIELSMIHMKITQKQVGQFKEQWNIPGIDRILIKPFRTWDGSQEDIKKMAEKSQLMVKDERRLEYPCLRPWFVITVLWDGRVVPCCYDYDGKYIIGDLNKESLEEIWNNKNMVRLREQHIKNNLADNPLCINCREKEGAKASKFYPLNPFHLIGIGIGRIISSYKRKNRDR